MQERARKTREKILDALEALLADKELEQVSIADIASQAGISVGSVYSHFKDRDALLPALIERRTDRVAARYEDFTKRNVWEGVQLHAEGEESLRGLLAALLKATHKQLHADRGMLRALLTQRRLQPDLDMSQRDEATHQWFDAFCGALEPYRNEIASGNVEEAAKFAFYFMNVVFLDEAMFQTPPLPTDLMIHSETKLQAYTDMLYLYLTTPSAKALEMHRAAS